MFDRYVCLDIEMTGLRYRSDRVISLCLIEMREEKPTGEKLSILVNPDRPIPKKTTRIHGITDDDVRDKPFFAEHARAVFDFIGNMPLVTHAGLSQGRNLDMVFLNKELRIAGLPEIAPSRFVNQTPMAYELLKIRKFDDVLDHYGIDRSSRKKFHAAETDTVLLAECFPQLYRDYQAFKEFRNKPRKDFAKAAAPVSKMAELLANWKPSPQPL